MRIAAILTGSDERQRRGDIPLPQDVRKPADSNPSNFDYCHFDILGESLVSRTLAQLEKITNLPSIVLSGGTEPKAWAGKTSQSGAHPTAWDKAVARQLEGGAEVLVLARLTAYTDLDYEQLLEFHCRSGSPYTKVQASREALDVAVVNASVFGGKSSGYRKALRLPLPGSRSFLYHGYVNRLRQPRDYYQLLEDALCGRCGLKPRGTEIAPSVWCGEGAAIDRTANIAAPAFIGADAHIAACATVRAASIERDCEIDCGTEVTNSWVLENTYVGLALELRRSLVQRQRLFHLDREVAVDISDGRLIGVNSKSVPLFTNLEALFWGTPQSGA